jgi:hypothetical protein
MNSLISDIWEAYTDLYFSSRFSEVSEEAELSSVVSEADVSVSVLSVVVSSEEDSTVLSSELALLVGTFDKEHPERKSEAAKTKEIYLFFISIYPFLLSKKIIA